MLYREAMNAAIMKSFLRRLVKDVDRKVFLVLDNLKVDHSYPVKKWLEDRKDLMEVFYLPAYCSEINPDEKLNNDLKTSACIAEPVQTRTQLKRKAISHLKTLQMQPKVVKRFIEHPKVAYAGQLVSFIACLTTGILTRRQHGQYSIDNSDVFKKIRFVQVNIDGRTALEQGNSPMFRVTLLNDTGVPYPLEPSGGMC